MSFPADQAADRPADPPSSTRTPSKAQALFLVFVGGAIGVLVSSLLRSALAPTMSAPLALALVNIAGAFALGLLVGAIPDGDNGSRLLWGTGFLGGFTSFSAISASAIPMFEVAGYYEQSSLAGVQALNMPIYAIGLAFISLAVGMLAAMWGFRLASGIATNAEQSHERNPGQNRQQNHGEGQ